MIELEELPPTLYEKVFDEFHDRKPRDEIFQTLWRHEK